MSGSFWASTGIKEKERDFPRPSTTRKTLLRKPSRKPPSTGKSPRLSQPHRFWWLPPPCDETEGSRRSESPYPKQGPGLAPCRKEPPRCVTQTGDNGQPRAHLRCGLTAAFRHRRKERPHPFPLGLGQSRWVALRILGDPDHPAPLPWRPYRELESRPNQAAKHILKPSLNARA